MPSFLIVSRNVSAMFVLIRKLYALVDWLVNYLGIRRHHWVPKVPSRCCNIRGSPTFNSPTKDVYTICLLRDRFSGDHTLTSRVSTEDGCLVQCRCESAERMLCSRVTYSVGWSCLFVLRKIDRIVLAGTRAPMIAKWGMGA